jgi:hypothetical protein
MFGPRDRESEEPDKKVAVDATLEIDIAHVEAAIDAYVSNPTESARQALKATLERLDTTIDRSDEFHRRRAATNYHYTASLFSVLGETSATPLVDEVPGPELRAQIDLVKAAKECVREATPMTLADLEAACGQLATIRSEA